MGAKEMDSMRRNVRINAADRLRAVIQVAGQSRDVSSIDFECVTCEEQLQLDSRKGWWDCPGCGQETTKDEMVEFLKQVRAVLQAENSPVVQVGTERKPEVSDGREDEGFGLWALKQMKKEAMRRLNRRWPKGS